MFRRQQDLDKILDNAAMQLEQFIQFTGGSPEQGGVAELLEEMVTEKGVKSVKAILSSVSPVCSSLENLLDKGIQDLETCGMKTNKSGKVENIFAKYATAKTFLDNTTCEPEDHFGQVIKNAYGVGFRNDVVYNDKKEATSTLTGDSRNQACLAKVQAYETDMEDRDKKQLASKNDLDTQFIRNLIHLRIWHNNISNQLRSIPLLLDIVAESLADPNNPDKADKAETARIRIGGQLRDIAKALRLEAEVVRKITAYDQLMSAKEFATIIPGNLQNKTLKEIKEKLTLLDPSSSSGFGFHKKSATHLSNEQRLTHLVELKKLVHEVGMAEGLTSKNKSGLEKLSSQLDYAILKESALIKKPAPSVAVAHEAKRLS